MKCWSVLLLIFFLVSVLFFRVQAEEILYIKIKVTCSFSLFLFDFTCYPLIRTYNILHILFYVAQVLKKQKLIYLYFALNHHSD